MKQYLFGSWEEFSLEPSRVRDLIQEGRDYAAHVRQLRPNKVLDILDRVGHLWRPGGAYREELVPRIAPQVGFSEEMVHQGLDALVNLLNRDSLARKMREELGSKRALSRWQWRQLIEGYTRAQPLGLVGHISPGNVFVGGADSIVHGLLTQNINFIKLASGDPVFPRLFVQSLEEADRLGELRGAVSLLDFRGQDRAVGKAFAQGLDGLVIWGGAEAIKQWRDWAPVGCRLVEYGPRFSFGLITEAGLHDHSLTDLATAIAADASLWEQRACGSPQVFFIQRGALSQDLLHSIEHALNLVEEELPQSTLTFDDKMDIGEARQLASFQASQQEAQVFFGPANWTVITREWNVPGMLPLNRTVVLIPYDELEEVAGWVSPYEAQFQSLGVWAAAYEWKDLASFWANRKVTRLVSLGSMGSATVGAPHDGTYQLQELVKWVSIEGVQKRFDASGKLQPPSQKKTDRLMSLISYAKARSPYYAQAFSDLSSESDFTDYPLLSSEILRQNSPPYSTELLTNRLRSSYVFGSGGSTGHPKFTCYSYSEWDEVVEILAAIYLEAGVQASDTVANLFMAGNMWSSFLAASQALEKLGCVTLPIAGNADINSMLKFLTTFQPTVVLGIPSVLVQLGEMVQRKNLNLKVRTVLYGGEAMLPAMVDYLRETLGVQQVVSAGYASVDAGPIGFQTEEQSQGVHTLLYDYQYLEFIDPVTQRLVPDGEIGEIVVTCLGRRLMPIIRYKTGDLGRLLPSNSLGPVFELCGRTQERIRIGSADITLEEIEGYLEQVSGLSPLFQLKLTKVGVKDALEIKVESESWDNVRLANLAKRAILDGSRELSQALEQGWLSKVRVDLIPIGSIERNPRTQKVVRVLDLRNVKE